MRRPIRTRLSLSKILSGESKPLRFGSHTCIGLIMHHIHTKISYHDMCRKPCCARLQGAVSVAVPNSRALLYGPRAPILGRSLTFGQKGIYLSGDKQRTGCVFRCNTRPLRDTCYYRGALAFFVLSISNVILRYANRDRPVHTLDCVRTL
ncbi:hypothetical protein F4680DRAFT_118766 [Xylaria scruposa]|nr:hypothetical protein F4680DRAFT_118766 [Xylaria scruposa]